MSVSSSLVGVIVASAYKLLAAFGIGAIAFVGFDSLFSSLTQQFQSITSTLPSALLALAGLSSLDLFFNAVMSGYSTVALLTLGKKVGILS